MKIALLSYEYPAETGFGGIGTYTWHHARALARIGHEVHVVAGARQVSALRSEKHDGVHVHRFWSGGLPMRALGAVPLPWTRQRLQNAWSMHLGLSALHEEHRFDVIEMPECGAEGAIITHRLDVPTIVRLHSPARLIMRYYDVSSLDAWCCPLVERRAITGATAITACSRFMATEAMNHLGLRELPAVISNGLDVDWFDSAEVVDVHAKYALPRRPLLLFSGRLERRKGVHLFAAIAAALLARHEIAFVLAGADSDDYVANTLLPQLATQPLKGSIHWLGAVGQSDLRSLVRSADVFVLPSLWENCPYSCLEAMAASRAIVAANQGGMPELIRHGVNGVLAEPGDAGGFIRAIEGLLADSAMRTTLGQAARRALVQSHDAELIASQAVEVYARAIARA